MAKPSIPQGTRDFTSTVLHKRQYIFSIIRETFELFGFEPLETPAMENLDTLMGKYGEEGDRLIFKILNNGLNDPQNHEKAKQGFEKVLQGKSSPLLTERALKYDLTIPFARFVAMNHGQLTYPYKRYQIQPVWRADRPQKGRYREFTQCDADVVGSQSLINEVELANIYHTVFSRLGLKDYRLQINSRKILTALAEVCGGADKVTDISIAIDKLDKIGIEKVKAELAERGLNETQISIVEKYLQLEGSNEEKLCKAAELFGENVSATEGLKEIRKVLSLSTQSNLAVDFTLARGLNYYTGIIFEVKAPAEIKMGSIGGGGRYDNLTGLFGVPGIAGVGISFGVDRIYDVLEEMKLFPEDLQDGTKVIFLNMGEAEMEFCYPILQKVRNEGISCELFHEPAKLDKQFKYADKKNIGIAVIIGSKEMEENKCVVKHLKTGHQTTLAIEELISSLKA